MTVYLDPGAVAERLGVSRRTAMNLMMDMHPSVICGNERKRIRVSEESLNAWMELKAANTKPIAAKAVGCKKRLQRR